MSTLENVNHVFKGHKISINFLNNLTSSRNRHTFQKRVLLFGSSVNPPTGDGGHRGICKYFADKQEFDEIWILPVYIHSFENKSALEFHYRMELCKLNFGNLSNETCRVIVQDFEKSYAIENGCKLYTADMLKKLRRKYPLYDFHWFMGWDTFIDLLSFNRKEGAIVIKNGKPITKWGSPEYILSTTPLHVATRAGVKTDWKNTDLYKEMLMPELRKYLPLDFRLKKIYPHTIFTLSDVSSTEIRKALKKIATTAYNSNSKKYNNGLLNGLLTNRENFSTKNSNYIDAYKYLNDNRIINKEVLTKILKTPDILSYYQGIRTPLAPSLNASFRRPLMEQKSRVEQTPTFYIGEKPLPIKPLPNKLPESSASLEELEAIYVPHVLKSRVEQTPTFYIGEKPLPIKPLPIKPPESSASLEELEAIYVPHVLKSRVGQKSRVEE
jgi:nicotinic acid mononucleotide adenylyltransferase